MLLTIDCKWRINQRELRNIGMRYSASYFNKCTYIYNDEIYIDDTDSAVITLYNFFVVTVIKVQVKASMAIKTAIDIIVSICW